MGERIDQAQTLGRDSILARIAIACICISAPLFAVLTFQPEFTMTAMRTYSLPLIATEIAVILLAFFSGFRLAPTLRSIPKPVLAAIIIWLFVALLGAAISAYRFFAFFELGLLMIHLAFALALFDRLSGSWRRFASAFLLSLAVSITLYAVVVHAFAASVWSDPNFDWLNIGAGAIHVRHLGFYGVALVGLSLGFLVNARKGRRMAIAVLCLAVGYYLSAWSGGRNPFLMCIIGSTAFILYFGGQRKRRLLAMAAATAMIAMPITFLTQPPGSNYGLATILKKADPSHPKSTQTMSSRLAMWEASLEATFAERPLIGHGRGSFVREITSYSLHPHNLPVQLLYNWGLIGTGALFVLFLLALRRVPMWAAADPASALPAIGALGLLFLISGADGPFRYGFPLMVLALCSAVLGSIGVREAKQPSPTA